MNQSTINIEEKKTLLCLCHIEAIGEIPMTNDERMTEVK